MDEVVPEDPIEREMWAYGLTQEQRESIRAWADHHNFTLRQTWMWLGRGRLVDIDA